MVNKTLLKKRMELVGTALSPGKLMLRLERLERPSHQERNSNALGGAAAGERLARGGLRSDI